MINNISKLFDVKSKHNLVETIIEESENGEKKVKFRGILSESDTFNGNHRIYKYQICHLQ